MKRSSKRYVISTNALNCYGYRVLTEGIDTSQYKRNRILLWMHIRATSNSKEQILALGNAVDFQVNGDELSCALEFDDTDDFAMKIYNKYENGTYNMLSLGAKPVEWSDEPALMLPGQTGPTFTKTIMTDVSCVDIGGNPDAVACQLYDDDDKVIELSNITSEGLIKLFNPTQTQTEHKQMKQILLTGPMLTGVLASLKLSDTANEADVQNAIDEFIELSNQREARITSLTAEIAQQKTKVAELIALSEDAKIEEVLKEAKDKILPAQMDTYRKLLKLSFEETKKLIDDMPTPKTVAGMVSAGKKTSLSEKAINLSWDDMDKNGTLPQLKSENLELFKTKFAEKFGREYSQ